MKKILALAAATLLLAGLASCTLPVKDAGSEDAPVASASRGPDTIETPAEPEPAPEPVAPALTIGQQNAVSKAETYLSFMSFSRPGLIDQLAFDGFSSEDATFAVDYLAPDWNVQAAEKAETYLSFMAFSRDALYDQLVFDGFTDAEALAGLAAVGY